jgi:DNA-binding response OmpR family regulator
MPFDTRVPTRVLVLDADTTFGGELRAFLNRKDLPTVVVSNGRTGLERALSSKPEVVVLAAELPGMNGFRVCTKLRQDPALASAKILMLYEAASRAAVREHKKLATHADSYLKKPVFIEELAARVERLAGTHGSVPPPKPRRTGRTVPPPKTPTKRPPPPDPADVERAAKLEKDLAAATQRSARVEKDLAAEAQRFAKVEKDLTAATQEQLNVQAPQEPAGMV